MYWSEGRPRGWGFLKTCQPRGQVRPEKIDPARRLRVDGAGTGSRLQAGAAPRTIDDEHSERVQADARSPAMILLCNANPSPDEIFGKDSRHQRRSRPDAADASAR